MNSKKIYEYEINTRIRSFLLDLGVFFDNTFEEIFSFPPDLLYEHDWGKIKQFLKNLQEIYNFKYEIFEVKKAIRIIYP